MLPLSNRERDYLSSYRFQNPVLAALALESLLAQENIVQLDARLYTRAGMPVNNLRVC